MDLTTSSTPTTVTIAADGQNIVLTHNQATDLSAALVSEVRHQRITERNDRMGREHHEALMRSRGVVPVTEG